MQQTTNYGWNMPEPTDPVNSSAEYAENMQSIDTEVHSISDIVGSLTDDVSALDTAVGDIQEEVNNIKVDYLAVDGSNEMANNIDMNNNQLVRLATPTGNNNAATKKYVDDIADDIKSDYLAVDGSNEMANNIDMNNNQLVRLAAPTGNNNAATKKYVDDLVAAETDRAETAEATKLAKSGGIMTGGIGFTSQGGASGIDGTETASGVGTLHIGGVKEPVQPNDVATKKFVDEKDFVVTYNGTTIDKTYSEVLSAYNAGKRMVLKAFHGQTNSNVVCDNFVLLQGGNYIGWFALTAPSFYSAYGIFAVGFSNNGDLVTNWTQLD